MKVVFLDIDGVLNEEKSRSRCCGYKGIDDKKVENLAKIIKTTNAAIVLISTWKDDWFRPSLIFPEYRKQGIATKLISRFKKDMIKQQYDTILLSVPSKSEAIDFFKHFNFKQIGYTNITYETEELIYENILINRDVF